jgi:hypothetical protein
MRTLMLCTHRNVAQWTCYSIYINVLFCLSVVSEVIGASAVGSWNPWRQQLLGYISSGISARSKPLRVHFWSLDDLVISSKHARLGVNPGPAERYLSSIVRAAQKSELGVSGGFSRSHCISNPPPVRS